MRIIPCRPHVTATSEMRCDEHGLDLWISHMRAHFAFGTAIRECENELRFTLEDMILMGLQLKHPLPVIAGIDLNKEPAREPLDAL
jgi:hypothetical protein